MDLLGSCGMDWIHRGGVFFSDLETFFSVSIVCVARPVDLPEQSTGTVVFY